MFALQPNLLMVRLGYVLYRRYLSRRLPKQSSFPKTLENTSWWPMGTSTNIISIWQTSKTLTFCVAVSKDPIKHVYPYRKLCTFAKKGLTPKSGEKEYFKSALLRYLSPKVTHKNASRTGCTADTGHQHNDRFPQSRNSGATSFQWKFLWVTQAALDISSNQRWKHPNLNYLFVSFSPK